jgi:hypothetical protein
MIVWLDHKIFGNGHGLGSPFFDGRFYWLKNKNTGHSEFYTFNAWLGAQLHSFQWTHPNAGEERFLCGRRFRPLHSSRKWGRVTVSWSWVDLPRDLDAAHIALAGLKHDLGEYWPTYADTQPREVLKGAAR